MTLCFHLFAYYLPVFLLGLPQKCDRCRRKHILEAKSLTARISFLR